MKTARRIAAGFAVAALALTGCSEPPSAAATVNGVRIPDTDVRRTAQVLTAHTGTDTSVTLRQSTFDLVLGEASRTIAAERGMIVSQADKDAALASNQAARAVADTPEGAQWADAVSTAYLVIQRLGSESFADELRQQDITVNPRYGTWAPEQFTMVDSALSQAATATAPR